VDTEPVIVIPPTFFATRGPDTELWGIAPYRRKISI
jgi:hypothetical protein